MPSAILLHFQNAPYQHYFLMAIIDFTPQPCCPAGLSVQGNLAFYASETEVKALVPYLHLKLSYCQILFSEVIFHAVFLLFKCWEVWSLF